MRWFSRGDVDGFFGLALDNLVQLLLVDALCRHILGFSNELVYGRVLPGVAVSLVVGNLYYARQAKKLADETGRTDVCALPYGINTVSLFGHVFLVMLPAKLAAQGAGAADPARVAWQAGLAATLGSGVIELSGAFVAEKLRRAAPRAAMLSTLAGIALGFISLGFLFRTFARPIVGMTTLAVVLLAPSALETVHSHPFGLSHYTYIAGGVPGAADLGMNRQFWGFTTGSVTGFLRQHLPEGGSVYVCDTTFQAMNMLVRDGDLPSNIRPTPDLAGADFVLVHHEHHFAEVEYQAWVAFGTRTPAHVLTYDGVPIVTIYENPRRRTRRSTTPP